MATLETSFPSDAAIAIVVPKPTHSISVTFSQFKSAIASFQQKLASLGVSHHSAVSIAIPNSYEFVTAFLAVSWQRAIAAPLNPNYKQEEFEFYIDDLKSALVLVPKGAFAKDTPAVRAGKKFEAAIAECYWDGNDVVLDVKDTGTLNGKGNQSVLKPEPDDIALVLHTSGTTGRPKAVPLTHANLTTTMKNIRATYSLDSHDRTMLVMPLFHVHGLLAGFLSPLSAGGSVIIPPRFSASTFWDDFIVHKANWYTAVPTIHQILLRSPLPNSMPKIRFIRSCSSPLSPKVFHDLESATNAPVLEAYAMTEASHQMTSNPLPPLKRKPGSVGIGQGVEICILSPSGERLATGAEGEISIRGPNVTKGYLNNPAANASSFTKDGFFRTGDQGKLDEEGYVYITGRIKELINKGGEKISPIELDNVLIQHPKVAEAVSFAIEDEVYGQDIGVAIVVKDGESLEADTLKSWIADKVVKFKVPKLVFFTKTMPKTATGKIQRRIVASAMLEADSQKAKL